MSLSRSPSPLAKDPKTAITDGRRIPRGGVFGDAFIQRPAEAGQGMGDRSGQVVFVQSEQRSRRTLGAFDQAFGDEFLEHPRDSPLAAPCAPRNLSTAETLEGAGEHDKNPAMQTE